MSRESDFVFKLSLRHKLKSFAAPYFTFFLLFINERIAFTENLFVTLNIFFYRHVQLINFHEHGNIPRLSRITCNSGNAAHARDVMRLLRVRLLLEFIFFDEKIERG